MPRLMRLSSNRFLLKTKNVCPLLIRLKMKKCFKCGEEKEFSEFYTHAKMTDGHLSKCKKCTCIDSTINRNRNVEKIRAYDRRRGNRQSSSYYVFYKVLNSKKKKASGRVNNAVRDGKIEKKTSCENCGSDGGGRIYGHHNDYDKPLEVVWLCQACHCQWHAKNGEGLNAGGEDFN
jgi:hypothetical protein